MATYRNIQLSFWTDSKVADDFTPEDKYFYLYLLTNPHTNTCGCYELSVRQMSIETGYSKESVEKLLERFALVHNIVRYSKENKEVLIINWRKYNWTSSEKLRTSVLSNIKLIKTKSFKDFLTSCFENEDEDETEYPINTVSDEESTPIDTQFSLGIGIVSDSKEEKKKAEKEKEKLHAQEVDELFERLWSLYIRKKGKTSVNKASKEEIFKVGFDRMEKCIQKYAAEKQGSEEKYILMGSTFFNGRYKDYLDEDIPEETPENNGQLKRELQ